MLSATLIRPQTARFSLGAISCRLFIPGIKNKELTVGYIGNLTINESPAHPGHEAERIQFLKEARARLFAMGAQKVIGPVDGDTWHRYRLPLDGGHNLSFLEPDYSQFVPSDFIQAGLPVLATYRTSAISDIRPALEKLSEPGILSPKMLAEMNVNLRTIKVSDFENEMVRLHQFSLDAFEDNFLFSPIDFETFRTLYLPIKNLIREEMVLIAESADQERRVLGVVFALPDPRDNATCIVKTLARSKYAPRGLGRYLFYEVLARACQLGYKKALCTLMKDDNFSAFLPEQLNGKVLRRFALFGCTKD